MKKKRGRHWGVGQKSLTPPGTQLGACSPLSELRLGGGPVDGHEGHNFLGPSQKLRTLCCRSSATNHLAAMYLPVLAKNWRLLFQMLEFITKQCIFDLKYRKNWRNIPGIAPKIATTQFSRFCFRNQTKNSMNSHAVLQKHRVSVGISGICKDALNNGNH